VPVWKGDHVAAPVFFNAKAPSTRRIAKGFRRVLTGPEWIDLLRRVLLKSRLFALLGELCRFALKVEKGGARSKLLDAFSAPRTTRIFHRLYQRPHEFDEMFASLRNV